MARQLWHLALADVLSALMPLPWFALTLAQRFVDLDSEHLRSFSLVCAVCHVNNIPFLASVFLEVHIAVTTICSILHFSTALRVLSRVLPLMWALGFIIGVVVLWIGSAEWNHELGVCEKPVTAEVVKAVVMTVALAICVAIYIAGFLTARCRSGALVEGRVWSRAKMFVAAAVVTWVPFLVFSAYLHLTAVFVTAENLGVYFGVLTVLSANGFVNAFLYALQSGYVGRTVRRMRRLGDDESLVDTPSVQGTSQLDASFHVAFTMADEVVMVSAHTHSANITAQTEIAALRAGAGRNANGLARGREEEEFLSCFEDGDTDQDQSRGISMEINQDQSTGISMH